MTTGCEKLNREDMRRYIRAVHADDSDGLGFIVWAEKRKTGVWKQHGYKWPDLLQRVRKVEGKKNFYLSLQTFCAPFRRAETLFRLNAIGFDIDFHNGNSTREHIIEIYHYLEKTTFEKGGLPPPSIAIFTGRGLQLVYLLDVLPKQGLPLWRLVGEAMAGRLRTALKATGGELDGNYSDITRVLRMPGTYNTEAGEYAEILSEDIVRYRLDALRNAYLPELIIPPKTAPPKREEGRVTRLHTAYSLHMARLEDIVTLRGLRQAADIPEDCRRRMVFLYRYWSCFSVGPVTALEAALAFNEGFAVPLSASVVTQATRSAEVAYARWMEDSAKGYNYRNDTLIRLLGITAEEQEHLKTIINSGEKRRRQKDRNWYHDKRDTRRAQKREAQEMEILHMLNNGVPHRKIAETLNVSTKTIARIKNTSRS